MNADQLKQVENLCDIVFTKGRGTAEDKTRAQQQLSVLGTNARYIPQCQHILDASSNQYALVVAAGALTKLITEHWRSFSLKQRLDIRNYLLTYLARNGPKLDKFVITAVVQLLCRITKLGWFDKGGDLRKIVQETTAFVQETVQHCIIGLKILNELVVEFNHPVKSRTLSDHRKAAVSFRDLSLFQVFEIAITVLRQVLQGTVGVTDASLEDVLLDAALTLVVSILSFDFIGTNPDESADEVGTIQLPAKWRPVVENAATMKTLVDIYKGCSLGTLSSGASSSAGAAAGSGAGGSGAGAGASTGATRSSMVIRPQRAKQALECLVLFISVRRSLFQDNARKTFLLRIMTAVCEIMRERIGLHDMDCYHQFCRLLGKLKANYQLSDLVTTAGYPEWIKLAADFAVTSFKQIHNVSNSAHYILGLWSRLVAAAPHLSSAARAVRDPQLDVYAPTVAFSYIENRVLMAEAAVAGKIENDLDDEDLVLQQLEVLPVICRYQYATVAKSTTDLMDPLLRRMQELLTMQRTRPGDNSMNQELEVVEEKLAWLVYFVSAMLGGQSIGYYSYTSAKPGGHELTDADLSRRVLQLLNAIDMRISSTSGAAKCSPHLEMALVYYISNFRKAYIGEQHGMPTPGKEDVAKAISSRQRAFESFINRLGMGSHLTVVSSFIVKIGNNLRFWGDDSDIIHATLQLFAELAWTYSSVKLLLTLPAVKHMLANHSEDHFPFLKRAENTRMRTKFYTALGRLLFMDDGEGRFEAFMAPLLHTLQQIQASLGAPNAEVARRTIGIARDLRGLLRACNSSRTYRLVFEALYPTHLETIAKALHLFAGEPTVTTPVLKFMQELCHNKAERIRFGNMSPNGILLFRTTSQMLGAYAGRIIGNKPPSEPYANKYKGISICLHIFSSALVGGYVQFGVFELYKDPALNDAVKACLQMALDMPVEDIVRYPKVATQYYTFINALAKLHLRALVTLEPPIFAAIVNTIRQGLDSIDMTIATLSSGTMDCMATHYVEHAARPEGTTQRALRAQVAAQPTLFASFASTIFNILVFGEIKRQWSLARPLLSLILACEVQRPKSFDEFKVEFMRHQPKEAHAGLIKAFSTLMDGVKTSLDSSNRERFSTQLTAFRSQVAACLSAAASGDTADSSTANSAMR